MFCKFVNIFSTTSKDTMINRILCIFFMSTFVWTFQPQTTAELQTAVDMWIDDNETALSTYGEINTWDVSLITNMHQLFIYCTTFNDDISAWDVSNVTDMSYIFYDANQFNQDLSSWNVSSAVNMELMFYDANQFNQDLSYWDGSNYTSGIYILFMKSNDFIYSQQISLVK